MTCKSPILATGIIQLRERPAAAIAVRVALAVSIAARPAFLIRHEPDVPGAENLFEFGGQLGIGGDLERRRTVAADISAAQPGCASSNDSMTIATSQRPGCRRRISPTRSISPSPCSPRRNLMATWSVNLREASSMVMRLLTTTFGSRPRRSTRPSIKQIASDLTFSPSLRVVLGPHNAPHRPADVLEIEIGVLRVAVAAGFFGVRPLDGRNHAPQADFGPVGQRRQIGVLCVEYNCSFEACSVSGCDVR